jgi:hypothetical protein
MSNSSKQPTTLERVRNTALRLSAAAIVLWGISSLLHGQPDQEPETFPYPPVATLFPTLEGMSLETELEEATLVPYYRGAAELPATSAYTTTATPTWEPLR